MGIKEFVKEMKEEFQRKKEIKKKQRAAYLDQLEIEAVEMGKKQAQMESKHREKMYGKKLEVVEERRTTRLSQGPVDVLGLNRGQGNQKTKQFNIITGKYEN